MLISHHLQLCPFLFSCALAHTALLSFYSQRLTFFFPLCLPPLLPPSPPLSSLVEDRVGGGLLAFLHRVLCARPGLGSGPYPLSTLSRFSDSHPSSSFPLNTLPPPPQPLQLPLVASLTAAPASNSVLCNNSPPSLASLAITYLSTSSNVSYISLPSFLPLTLFHFSSTAARGSRSSLGDTDAPSCSGRATWERSIGRAVCYFVFQGV